VGNPSVTLSRSIDAELRRNLKRVNLELTQISDYSLPILREIGDDRHAEAFVRRYTPPGLSYEKLGSYLGVSRGRANEIVREVWNMLNKRPYLRPNHEMRIAETLIHHGPQGLDWELAETPDLRLSERARQHVMRLLAGVAPTLGELASREHELGSTLQAGPITRQEVRKLLAHYGL
jgi:hypothetical protein